MAVLQPVPTPERYTRLRIPTYQDLQAAPGRLADLLVRTLSFSIQILLHPIETFETLKYEGTYGMVLVLLIAFLLVRFAAFAWTAFPFWGLKAWAPGVTDNGSIIATAINPEDANPFIEIGRIVLPFLSWVIAHYAIAAIFYGEASFRNVVVGSAFSTVPMILVTVPLALLSQILTLDEKSLYGTIWDFAAFWSLLLIILMVSTMNDFSLRRSLGIFALTLFTIIIMWGCVLLVWLLTRNVWDFFYDVWYELVTR